MELKDDRKESREDLPIAFTYYYERKDRLQHERSFAINISKSGMSFYINEPLPEGYELCIKTPLCKETRKAVIRWSRHIVSSTWRVGVELIGNCPA